MTNLGRKTVSNMMRVMTTVVVVIMMSLSQVCLAAKKQSAAANKSLPKPVQIILDSDFGSSTDDLFALMMLHHYIDEGKVDLKGIVVDREGEKNAQLVDVFNTYYGHPDIPIALERNGIKNPRCFIPYSNIVDLKGCDGQLMFRRTQDVSRCPDGYKLYRQLLSKAEDKSIVVVAIGFATTLSQLFESGADEYSSLNGADLFGKKVKAVYIQAGRFESGDSLCGYNMRAASKQSAVFFSKLPKNVDIVMSPSNVGDMMDYPPKDVLVDLSYTETNPIKAVYTNYTCDTGQRMWDTNCLVQAVLGDDEYKMSPRGIATFVEKGEKSLLLFKEDASGNARFQLPCDSYYATEKIMDIRRHTRMNRYPAPYTIEAPQPQIVGDEALAWTQQRMTQLVDKYVGTYGAKLDTANIRNLFIPLGYTGENPQDYEAAERLLIKAVNERIQKRNLRDGLADAVNDARKVEASEVSNNLMPICKDYPGQEWAEVDGHDMVLVMTLVDSYRKNKFFDGKGTYKIDRISGTWVTLPADWKERSAHYEGLDSIAAHVRMMQMLGLDSECNYDTIVCFYADPCGMFRPAHDPAITTTTTGLEFPAYVDENYKIGETNFREWYRYNEAMLKSDNSPLPWTQLGYTYDWGDGTDHKGLAEYIVGHETLIKVKSVMSAWDFIRSITKGAKGIEKR